MIADKALAEDLEAAINGLDCIYVADGHHRSAAASRVRALRKDRNPDHKGDESHNYFLAVLFPHDQMQILDYNRIIKDLNDQSSAEFLGALSEKFEVETVSDAATAKPTGAQQFGLYLDKQWYRLHLNKAAAAAIDAADPVNSLDVSIMQNTILGPLLDIQDQRTDKRVDFVGGIRGLVELEKRVGSGDWQAAIALYPTSIESLMAIADAGEVMPPKSTWFEPKLKSGLVVHVLD
jgi:uncharacterized protein (DUF1015 family)